MKEQPAILRYVTTAIAVAAISLVSAAAVAKNLYVRAGASGDGSKASPYGTLDEAMRDSFAGDVIHVAKGTYYGAGGGGHFVIDKPNLTWVGGYDNDFTSRDPFKNITRLMRGEDPDPKICRESKRCTELVKRQKVPQTKASYNAMAIVEGRADQTGFIFDGFVVDGFTRHKYKSNEDLSLSMGPIGTPGMSFKSPGVKIRNSIIMNIAGPGILMVALGNKLPKGDDRESGDDWGEISNCIVVNTLMESLEFRVGNMDEKNAPDGGAALIKNNTLAFNWARSGEDYNIIQGRQTRLTIRDNILAFAGYGIHNGFGNRFGRYTGNVFFSHTGGSYGYWDVKGSGQTLILDDVTQLAGKKCNKNYACSKQSEGNVSADPKFTGLDPFFFDKFMNQIASTGGGKVNMDTMNQWRSALGLNLQGSKGSGVVNYAPIWDPGEKWDKVLLFSSALEGKGAQANGIGGKLQAYESAGRAGAAGPKEYQEVTFADIKRGGGKIGDITGKGDTGLDITVTLAPGPQNMSAYYLPDTVGAGRDKGWVCYQDKDRQIYLYLLKGTEALDTFKQALAEGADVVIEGTAYDLAAKIKSAGRVGIKVDTAETDDED